MNFNEDMQRNIEAARDKVQMARLIQHARWLIMFGHLRRGWPNSDQ